MADEHSEEHDLVAEHDQAAEDVRDQGGSDEAQGAAQEEAPEPADPDDSREEGREDEDNDAESEGNESPPSPANIYNTFYHIFNQEYGQQAGYVGSSANFDATYETKESTQFQAHSGPVREDEISNVNSVFIQPEWFAKAARVLCREHLVVVQGPEGVGKRTGALKLLQGQQPGKLRAYEPHTKLQDISQREEEESWGYLIDGVYYPQEQEGSRIQVDRLAERLRAHDDFVVITTCADYLVDRVDDAYIVRADSPDIACVLQSHFAAWLGPEEFAVRENILMHEDVREAVDGVYKAASAAALARELAHVSHDRHVGRALQLWRGAATEEAANLLRTCDRPENQALLVAVAVFEGEDQEIVTEAADRLTELAKQRREAAARMQHGEQPSNTYSREGAEGNHQTDPHLFASPLQERLAAISAHRAAPDARRTGPYLTYREDVQFDEGYLAGALLPYVWREYREARSLLLSWLASTPLGHSQQAARAAGRMVRGISGYRAVQPLADWAASHEPHKWLMAAEALSIVAAEPSLASQVSFRLKQWERAVHPGYRHAVVAAYGGTYGRAHLDDALDGLGRMADRIEESNYDDAEVVLAISRSVTGLARDPGIRWWVLHVLKEWTRKSDTVRYRAGVDAFLGVLQLDASAPIPRFRHGRHLLSWARDVGETETVVVLTRRALEDQRRYAEVRAALLSWDTARGSQEEYCTMLVDFFHSLFRAPFGRGACSFAIALERQILATEEAPGDNTLLVLSRDIQDVEVRLAVNGIIG